MNPTIAHYWAQVDEFSHFIAYVLLAMSLVSWFILLYKSWSFWRIRRAAASLSNFWQAPSLADALALLHQADFEEMYVPLARESIALAAIAQAPQQSHLNAKASLDDLLTRVLRQQLNRATVRLEAGLSLLASIGATAPFVGLLGTVWGICHALTTVATAGNVQIAQVAGPVGEALMMTALGLLVAIPAVLAYNAFNRLNRICQAELDAFAYDLHAHLTKA
ncbi:MotA/TolQ/ExbB proton channel family protein [Undibacterium sp. Jales W-56]|uniref:MotA/TolQ/ExbB proton channel family protein n=1 Tax=Undibacterium sp. Jales W-56 TaxID=2897325 RepID=UPI0021CFC467|nr:MotA/TolQ/ExbB proton channel family protein [Undibacterium sp. Jales W-56]MCU6434687.1 MotA/TolQ/ExbB proton channel family protein [Undibacterium sp. Jales W-56]